MKGYRKLAVAAVILVLSFIALMTGKMSGMEWTGAAGMVLTAFGVGNAIEHKAGGGQ